MEKSFDLGSLLKKHQKKHKCKPTQFESVASGVHKRMETCNKLRKSSRLTSFDCARNLPQASPVPELSDAKQKADNRKKQLLKWKEQKEQKKKELAAKKQKPFITGVPHNPIKYVPPPPLKPAPSSSGRVTRSQAAKNQKEIPKVTQAQSFAPNNAGFRAPQIKTLVKIPQLELVKNKKDVTKTKFSFQPVVPKTTASGTSRTRTSQRIGATRTTAAITERNNPKGRIAKPVSNPKKPTVVQSSSSENESYNHTSTSDSDVDKTVRMLSSSENSNIFSSTDSSKSLQSSSSCEIVPEEFISKRKSITLSSLRKSNEPVKDISLQSSSSCEIVPEKSISKRKSIPSRTPSKSIETVKDKFEVNTPRNLVPKSESSSEEKLRSPKSLADAPMTPEQIAEEFKNISPCVTMSRGKDNARKEMKKKLEAGLLDEDASDMDSVEHFQKQLDSETKRLTEICNIWDKVNEQVALPESIQGMLLGAVGQARLLMTKKMQQFAELVQRCARPEPGATLVTPADLRGFWDMVFLQVENVDMRFKQLEELKARDWVEVAAPAAASRKPRTSRPAVKPSGPRPAARPGGGPSRLRDMIAAARKAKAQEAAQSSESQQSLESQQSSTEERTFEAGFFCVRSPARSPHTPATPKNKQNLLKAVLSSEAEKASASKRSASFAMLRASVFGKNVECDGVAPLPQTPLPQINFNATPSRSILKQPQDSKTTVKQIKVVLFDHAENETDQNPAESVSKDNINGEANGDISPMDMDEKETDSRTKRNSRITQFTRQDAFATESPSPPTRRMKKHQEAETSPKEQKTLLPEKKKRSSRKSVQAEKEPAKMEQNPQPSEQESLPSEKKTPKRSARKKVAATVENTEVEIESETDKHSEKRTSRRSVRNKIIVEIDVTQTSQQEQEMSQEQNTPKSEKKTPKRSVRKKVSRIVENTETLEIEQEIEDNSEKRTSRRSIRNKVLVEIEDVQTTQEMSQSEQKTPHLENKTPKRSSRKKEVNENSVQKENVTPARSMRRRKTKMTEEIEL